MSNMFNNAYEFNQNIGNWDVSKVTTMKEMFYIASEFNQDLSNWDVDGVRECSLFAASASSFTNKHPSFTNCTP